MMATVKEWNRYQAVKASLSQEQQNVLSKIEGYAEPGVALAEVDISNDQVNDCRRGKYLSVENVRFLFELGNVDIGGPNEPTVQKLFKMARAYYRRDRYRFVIRLSDYFSKVIARTFVMKRRRKSGS
ncbi:hypothetical protein [Negativicoccus succinicivorans]